MAKLTKREAKAHDAAQALLDLDRPLTIDEKIQIVENWNEGAVHSNTKASAFFTPWALAKELGMHAYGPKVLDLCAGIGILAMGVEWQDGWRGENEYTLVEINPDYAAIAKRLLPQAEVIVGSIYDRDLMAGLAARGFDSVLSNPPFGSFARPAGAKGPRYKGEAHYEVIDIASDLAEHGAFILPQTALPFKYSGQRGYQRTSPAAYEKFYDATGIELGFGIGVDTTLCGSFRGVSIITEITTADFGEARERRTPTPRPVHPDHITHAAALPDVPGQLDLFEMEVLS